MLEIVFLPYVLQLILFYSMFRMLAIFSFTISFYSSNLLNVCRLTRAPIFIYLQLGLRCKEMFTVSLCIIILVNNKY